jgi:excisionase family DNA binding protein
LCFLRASDLPGTKAPYTAGAVAQLVGCHPVTVRRAIDRGELDAFRLGTRGTYRIRPEALNDWLRPVANPKDNTL